MAKIGKALKKLSKKERQQFRNILEKLNSNQTKGLNIKKLKDREDIFRVRKGDLRVIFRRDKSNEIFILSLEKRSEKTYKNL